MMKTPSCIVTLAAAATIVIASVTAAISQEGHSGMHTSGQQSQGMMDMSAMKQEPHHVLAMAYKENLVHFTKALRHHATQATTVDADFARAAVAEMNRSFDQMQQHHQDHVKTMDEQMKARTADMMKQMDQHHSAIKEHLGALDKEVHASAPDAKSIAEDVDELLKQCDGMAKMHGGTMDHKMTEPKDQKMH